MTSYTILFRTNASSAAIMSSWNHAPHSKINSLPYELLSYWDIFVVVFLTASLKVSSKFLTIPKQKKSFFILSKWALQVWIFSITTLVLLHTQWLQFHSPTHIHTHTYNFFFFLAKSPEIYTFLTSKKGQWEFSSMSRFGTHLWMWMSCDQAGQF